MKRESAESTKGPLIPAALALGAAIAPYVFLAFFAVPAADDFVQAAMSLERGVLGFIQLEYLTWTGRYSSNLVIATFNAAGHHLADHFLLRGYFIVPLALILLYLLANFVFFRMVTGSRRAGLALLFSLVATLAILTNTDLSSTVYWLAGGATYGLANSLFIASLALTVRTIFLDPKGIFLVLVNLAMIVFIQGLSETIMASYAALLVAMLAVNFATNSASRRGLAINLAYAAAALASSAVVYFAPGNRIRAAVEGIGKAYRIMPSLGHGLWSTIVNSFHWIISPSWVFLVLLVIWLGSRVRRGTEEKAVLGRKAAIATIASLSVSLFVSYFVRWYSLNGEGPPRANSTSYTLLLAITVMAALVLGKARPFPRAPGLRLLVDERVFLPLVAAFCLVSVGLNYRLLQHDFGVLRAHRQYYSQTYPLLIGARPGSDVECPPEPRVRIMRYSNHLTSDRNHPINKAYARYFHLNSVVCRGDGCPNNFNE